MARRGINKQRVFEAADRLAAQGERVTVTRLREEVGNTGSYTTLSAYLKAWRGQDGTDDPDPERLPDGVEGGALQLVQNLWRGLARLVERLSEERRRRADAQFHQVEDEVGHAEQELQALTERHRHQAQLLEELRRRDAAREEAVQRLEREVEALRNRLEMTTDEPAR